MFFTDIKELGSCADEKNYIIYQSEGKKSFRSIILCFALDDRRRLPIGLSTI